MSEDIQEVKNRLKDFEIPVSERLTKLKLIQKLIENTDEDNLNADDVNKAVAAGFIFYNPINKQPIPKYAGRINLGRRINLGGRINLAGELNPKVWNLLKKPRGPKGAKIMPHYAYRVHSVPSQILSQVPEDINKTLKEDTFKQSEGCKTKVSKVTKKQNTKCSSKGTKGSSCRKITSLDELRMKYSK